MEHLFKDKHFLENNLIFSKSILWHHAFLSSFQHKLFFTFLSSFQHKLYKKRNRNGHVQGSYCIILCTAYDYEYLHELCTLNSLSG